MPKAYSLDLRERVGRFVEAGQSRHAAAAHFQVSVSFVVSLMKTYYTSGRLGRRHSKLDPYRAFLLARVAATDDITMPELSAELVAATGTKVEPASLSRWLIRDGYRFKKNLLASEQDRPDIKAAREAWTTTRQPRMQLEPHRLVFFDETGTTTKMTRLRGRCLKGQRLRSKAPFGHWKIQTFIAGLRCDRLTAPFALRGLAAYPDATGTLHLSFGQAKGPVNDDGVGPFVTTIGGAFLRSTGRDPFALPASWFQAKEKLNLDLPLNVATTNETVGGNSGSPLLNKNAELIGLVFDSNLSGRGNAYLYRTEDRTVAVDSACILEILSKGNIEKFALPTAAQIRFKTPRL